MGEDMKRSPEQWAPRIDDPDPPEDSLMTPEASEKATEGVAKLMTERREQLGQDTLYAVLRNNPSLTREEAQALVEQFL
jgi:hypothetical protein